MIALNRRRCMGGGTPVEIPVVVATYNVTSTESVTKLIYSNNQKSNFTKVRIDGGAWQDVVISYTFSTTGEHTVEFQLSNSEMLGSTVFRQTPIKSIVFPEGLKSVDTYLCYQCTSLIKVTFPSTTTNIGGQSFYSCSALTDFTIKAIEAPTLGSNVLRSANLVTIYVPSESVDAYKAASGWSSYASKIQAIPTT